MLVTQRDLHFITDFRYDTQVRDEVGDIATVRIEQMSLWTGLWALAGSLSALEVIGFESAPPAAPRLPASAHRRNALAMAAAGESGGSASRVEGRRRSCSHPPGGEMAITALKKTLKEVRPGLTELNVAGILEKALRDEGSEDFRLRRSSRPVRARRFRTRAHHRV